MFNGEQVELWFSGQQELENPQDPDLPPVFDRQGKLKNVSYKHMGIALICPEGVKDITSE